MCLILFYVLFVNIFILGSSAQRKQKSFSKLKKAGETATGTQKTKIKY